jgi:hypothetical protein
VFENMAGDKQRVIDMNIHRQDLKYQIPALEEFLMKY